MPCRPVVWVNGALHSLPDGVSDAFELEKELSFIVATEHQFLQV